MAKLSNLSGEFLQMRPIDGYSIIYLYRRMLTDICRTPILFPLVSWLQPETHESCAIDIYMEIYRYNHIYVYILYMDVYGSLHTAVTTQIA